jgi:hypothetical protein
MSNLIYIALTAINLVFPLIFFLIYIYLTMEVPLLAPPSLLLLLIVTVRWLPLLLRLCHRSARQPHQIRSLPPSVPDLDSHRCCSGLVDFLSPDLGLLSSDHRSVPRRPLDSSSDSSEPTRHLLSRLSSRLLFPIGPLLLSALLAHRLRSSSFFSRRSSRSSSASETRTSLLSQTLRRSKPRL